MRVSYSIARMGIFSFIIGVFMMIDCLAWGQSSISTKSGKEIQIFDDSEMEMDNPLSDNPTYYLTPKEGSALAHVQIKEGTEVNDLFAEKITYLPKTEEFNLEGNARIQQGNNVMSGPVRIQYEPAKKTVILTGSKEKPAEILYTRDDGTPVQINAIQFTLTLDDRGRLKNFKTKGHLYSKILTQASRGKSGKDIQIGGETELEMADPLTKAAKYILTPKTGASRAHVQIKEGAELSHLFAKTITYYPSTERFYLNGQGRIERGEDFMSGPIRIDYNPSRNQMILVGSENNPSEIQFSREDGTPIHTKSVGYTLLFDTTGKLQNIKSKGQISSIVLLPGEKKAPVAKEPLRRKLSGPK